MKKTKKMLSLLCALCLLMNVLVAGAADEHIDAGEMTIINRRPILTLGIGSADGQVAYGGHPVSGIEAPEAFVVEDDVIYILDGHNKRIVVWKDGNFSSIDISDCPRPKHLKLQNQRLGVVDNITGVTGIYSLEGEMLALIPHPQEVKDQYVLRLVEVSETSVVWETMDRNFYSYDWGQNRMLMAQADIVKTEIGDGMSRVTSAPEGMSWCIDSENKFCSVLGVYEDALYWEQFEYIPDVDMFIMEMSIRRIDENGRETYAIIDFEEWYASPLKPTYLSSNGTVYVMECFKEHVVISEVLLGITDISNMEELEARAAVRRREMAAERSRLETNGTASSLSISRTEVLRRAKAMVDFQWVMKDENKRNIAGVIIPDSVVNTQPG